MGASRRPVGGFALLGLAVALAALVVRFVQHAATSLTYDEAVYVQLAARPWHSAFYPDTVFLRHPPLYLYGLGVWTWAVGTSEWVVRLPSLVATVAGVVLSWDAARRRAGSTAAGTIGFLAAASFLVLNWGIQASMYPLAFGLVALGVWATTTNRGTLAAWAMAGVALTHLFGFVWIAVVGWRARRRLWTVPAPVWLAVAWLAVSVPAGLVFNGVGTGTGTGWQALRVFALFYEAFFVEGKAAVHILVFGLSLLLLGPVLLVLAWRGRGRWDDWTAGGLALTGLLLPLPAFLRYAMLVWPAVAVAGAGRIQGNPGRRLGALVLVLGVVATAAAGAYTHSELDPSAGNDVLGLRDWRQTASAFGQENRTVAVTAPPAFAYYLMRQGFDVVDSSQGPGRLVAEREDVLLVVVEYTHPAHVVDHLAAGSTVLVPLEWEEARQAGLASGADSCGPSAGFEALVPSGSLCPGNA